MLRRTFCLAAAAALVATAGCGSQADGLVKDMISDMNALADAMEKGDEGKVKECEERMKATQKKLDDLKLSEDEKKKLMEKHKGPMEEAGKRMMAAMMKKMGGAMGMPGLAPPGIPGVTPPGGVTAPGK
jgi:hypothetical protein